MPWGKLQPTETVSWSSLYLKDCTLWKGDSWSSSCTTAACGKDPWGKSVRRQYQYQYKLTTGPIPLPPLSKWGVSRRIGTKGLKLRQLFFLFLNKQRKIFSLVLCIVGFFWLKFLNTSKENSQWQKMSAYLHRGVLRLEERFIRYLAVFIVSGAICSCIKHNTVIHRALVPPFGIMANLMKSAVVHTTFLPLFPSNFLSYVKGRASWAHV